MGDRRGSYGVQQKRIPHYQGSSGLYRNDGRQGGKRRREEPEEDPMREWSYALFYLGDQKKNQAEDQRPVEEQVEEMSQSMRRLMHARPEPVTRYLLDCCVELGAKVPTYAMLIGLLNVDDSSFVGRVVKQAVADWEVALSSGDRNRARLLLRLMAALVVPGVLHPSALLNALSAVVNSALEIASEVPEGDDGRTWQPYTDFLVHAALMALPWGGPELMGAAAAEDIERLFASVTSYMEKRPRTSQPGLAPFYSATSPTDAAAESDSGGASFLGQVWEAVQLWRESGQWELESIPRVALQAYEAQLAAGEAAALPLPAVPRNPVGVPADAPPAEAAAAVAGAFPPRGHIALLSAEQTLGGRLAIERLIAQDYILDSIHYFDIDRVDSAVRLASGLPLPYKHEAILAEVLFSQLLRVPTPAFKPLAYGSLMVDLCKLLPTFPRSMSACVRECFARMGAADPELRGRLAEWLAYHLSNFEFMWPWTKWGHVLEKPPHDPQRHFVIAVLNRLIRLSYHDRVKNVLPEPFQPLLPPPPAVEPLPTVDDATDPSTLEGEPLEAHAAAEILQMAKQKVIAEEVQAWLQEGDRMARLGGPVGGCRTAARALLVAGGKSFTHTVVALERYLPLLCALQSQAGSQGERAMVEVCARVWASSPLRAAMAIDRLMALRLASAPSIVAWAFAELQHKRFDDELAAGLAWEALYAAVNKTLARTQDAQDDVHAARTAVQSHNPDLPAEEVEAAIAPPQQALQDAIVEQQELLLQSVEGFKELLAAEPAEGSTEQQDDGGDSAAAAWRSFALASLRSFLRKYFLPLAPLAQRLESEVFAADAVAADVREAALLSLHF